MLQKYNEIWAKVSDAIKKEFDSNLVYIKNASKNQNKILYRKINTNFHNNKVLKEGSPYICLSVILLGSIFKTCKNYYPQVLLEECKYVIKEKIDS